MGDKKNVTIILAAIIIIILLFTGAYLINKNKDDKSSGGNSKPEDNNSAIKDDFSKNDAAALSEDAYNLLKLIQFETINSCGPTSVNGIYYDKDYTVSTMPDGLKIYLGIMQYKDERNFDKSKEVILTKAEVRKGVEKVFGPDVKYKDTSFGTKACHGGYDAFTYDAATGNYTIKIESCDCDASRGEIVSKPMSTKTKDDEIVVTERVLFVVAGFNEKENDITYKLYNVHDFSKDPIADVKEFSYSDYEDKLSDYAFTFKKNKDGKYYFASVKKVK